MEDERTEELLQRRFRANGNLGALGNYDIVGLVARFAGASIVSLHNTSYGCREAIHWDEQAHTRLQDQWADLHTIATILRQYDFRTLPPVTEEDLQDLQRSRVVTSIKEPIAAFKMADAVPSIGFYRAVMGGYPDLRKAKYLTAADRTRILGQWQANPDLPVTFTIGQEDEEFAAELSLLTGRKFFIPTREQVEYAIRGRRDGGTGAISTDYCCFGFTELQVSSRAWLQPSAQGQVKGVREPLPGRSLDASKNSFGLIHPIGNVWVRSRDGVIQGGCGNVGLHQGAAGTSLGGMANRRKRNLSFRLGEAL